MKTAQADELIREIRELREEVARLRIATAPRFYPVYPTYVPWAPQPSYVPWYQTTTVPPYNIGTPAATFTVQSVPCAAQGMLGGGSC
jgi:hypothetical protein